jgi:uncharacterized membrane protein YgdD (TMEM256/DUF423 family)
MESHERIFGVVGAVGGFLAVSLGAFGAHALKARLSAADLEIFETAVRYHLVHAVVLVVLAALAPRLPVGPATVAGWSFTGGILVFSGSLYLLVLTGPRWLGAATPLGGIGLLVGWAALAWALLRAA